jgi:hypothetical protein
MREAVSFDLRAVSKEEIGARKIVLRKRAEI